MKLLLLFALLALICVARSAPTPATTPRVLVFQDYHEATDEEAVHDEVKVDDDETIVDAAEDDEDETTTTTTTTRRAPYIPTRNRNLIPSRRPIQTQRTTSVRTTTLAVEEDEENSNEYQGDFKYIRDFRKYVQKLMDDIRKLVRNLTGYDFANPSSQRQQYNQHEDDE